MSEPKEADLVTILSSDMIAQIVEEYFNKKVYRQKVEVVDTKPTEAGYMFSLAFVQREEKPKEVTYDIYTSIGSSQPVKLPGQIVRDKKGQFVKRDNV